MQKTALLKTSIREIKQSPARFLSILGIIFLGVAFFVGIGATGPDMIKSADHYYEKTKLADMSIYSSLGFSAEDKAVLLEEENIQTVNLQYLLDLPLSQKNTVFRFLSLTGKDELNQLHVVEGQLPKAKNEILLDSNLSDAKDYQIGDTFEILAKDDPENQLKEHEFKIVGFAQSPEFIDNSKRGNTNVGNGSITAFAYLLPEAFQMDAYSRMLISFDDLRTEVAYSQNYVDLMNKNKAQITSLLAPRKQGRLDEIREKALKELNDNQREIDEANAQIEKGAKQLNDALKTLEAGKKELEAGQQTFDSEMANAEAQIRYQRDQLVSAQAELDQQRATLESQQQALNQQSKELTAAEEQLEPLLAQKATLEASLAQLEGVQQQYGELVVLLDGFVEVPKEAQPSAIEAIKSTASALSAQLSASPELSGAFATFAAEVTVENIAETHTVIRSAGDLIEQQRLEVQQSLTTLATQQQELAAARQALVAGQAQIDAGRDALAQGQAEIDRGFEQLNQGEQTLAEQRQQGQSELDAARQEFETGQEAYEKEAQAFQKLQDETLPDLKAAQRTIDQEREKLDELEPATFTYVLRDDNPGYLEYEENANRISSIATVFPTIFFLIAALVSLTTMGRMIEEKRTEIGTYKALGYKNSEVSLKFIIYSLTAGLTGTLLGLLVGFYLFPTIIINAYGQLYNMTEFPTPWYLSYSLIGFAVGLFCTVGISMIVLRVDLMSSPATLLRPKAPKAGKTILLERIRPLWRRLNFNQKVTMRNLFRYKSRMFMTVFGIAGCTAMILTGFGLKNSISDIVPIQFNEVWRYQGIVTFDEEASTQAIEEYQAAVSQLDLLSATLGMTSENLTVAQTGKASQEVTVFVPENPAELSDFVSFTDRKTGEVYALGDNGVIINEKLAKLFQLAIGDTIELKNGDNEIFEVNISGITENYVGHFAYFSPTYYEEIFGEIPTYNSELLLFSEALTKEQENQIANDLMKQDRVLNVTFLSDSSTALDDTTEILNIVVWLLIISAGLLAFIVLYNLNNINISERIRELSTIKVLGFYNKEVTMYIYRENIFLTLFGIIAGLFLGQILHGYVLATVELDMLMFSPEIHLLSYLYSSLITLFFTIIVGFVMYQKLKHVDMIEALKSND
ncbi:MAG: ABC transporter permease [Enterococcus aquimarinus]|uniref:ABC transporter permease n=1 Tax=Enterococcus aquimarinus TaxID=328396 RepID=A0A9E3ZVK1_9ENTE|nr:ABC transporter permease [Enterococcus aquimarinus]